VRLFKTAVLEKPVIGRILFLKSGTIAQVKNRTRNVSKFQQGVGKNLLFTAVIFHDPSDGKIFIDLERGLIPKNTDIIVVGISVILAKVVMSHREFRGKSLTGFEIQGEREDL
jgi:hypothetical protein